MKNTGLITKSRKAFTNTEVCIILCLWAATVTLTVYSVLKQTDEKTKFNSITQKLQNGQNVSQEDVHFYLSNFDRFTDYQLRLEDARNKANSLIEKK